MNKKKDIETILQRVGLFVQFKWLQLYLCKTRESHRLQMINNSLANIKSLNKKRAKQS